MEATLVVLTLVDVPGASGLRRRCWARHQVDRGADPSIGRMPERISNWVLDESGARGR